MASTIIMPKLGMTMSEGKVAKWNKADGDAVQAGEEIAVVMSKKITYKLTAPEAGILRVVVSENEMCPVGGTLGFVTAPGEPLPEVLPPAAPGEPVTAATPSAVAAAPAPAPARPKGGFVPASPAARRLAKEHGLDLADVPGSGADGMVTEGDVRQFLETRAQAPAPAEVLATSAARQLARERGLNLAEIPGSGIGGRITEQDVMTFAAGGARPSAPAPTAAAPGLPQVIPFAGMRQAIAENMVASLQTTAQVTLTSEIDATELVKLRNQLKQDFELTFTDLLVRGVAKSLQRHPLLNATLIGDEIHLQGGIHVGVAVALPDGLMVPVVRNADRLSVQQIAEETRRLVQGTREGSLSVDEVTGGTFTITNLGAYGIDAFTPIINMPEVAILGVGRIVDKATIYNEQIARRSMMVLSLTIDHRIVDGAPGADFLRTLKDLLENPYRLLV